MSSNAREQQGLEAAALWFRSAWLTAFLAGITLLRLFTPVQISAWMPFHTSCGAITGLPCLFCGTTRAMHQLLNGNFSAALYYNWLAFPILAGALVFSAIFLIELIARRKLLTLENGFRFSPQTVSLGCAIILSLWVLQVYLAISQHKSELLNPQGLLYAFFVR